MSVLPVTAMDMKQAVDLLAPSGNIEELKDALKVYGECSDDGVTDKMTVSDVIGAGVGSLN